MVMVRALGVVLLLVACGSSAGTGPDAATADARVADAATPDAGVALARIDWRGERGAPIATTTATLSERDVIAASAAGYVTLRDCQPEVGCDYEWHDTAGGSLRARDDL